jgi:hypothetical protein
LKILAAADFHGIPSAERNLQVALGRRYDCVVLIGDLTNFGPVGSVGGLVDKAKAANVPVLVIPGNCDPKPVLGELEQHGVNLHGKRVKVGDITFAGFGGSNLTPFNTPFELTEGEIEEELFKLACNEGERWVLVTHAPPYNTLLDIAREGMHAGSKSVRKVIEQTHPLVALSGHIHESRNIDRLGSTLLVNPGPAGQGYVAEITITEEGARAELLNIGKQEKST